MAVEARAAKIPVGSVPILTQNYLVPVVRGLHREQQYMCTNQNIPPGLYLPPCRLNTPFQPPVTLKVWARSRHSGSLS